MLKQLDTSEAEDQFVLDAHDVLKHHVKNEQTATVKTGLVSARLLMIPVIIAVILTLPGYSDWKIDAVLIASMLLIAGMTVVPLLSKKKKISRTIIFSTLALLLIIFFVEMLFDNGGWLRFGEIAASVIFGLSIMFAPFVINQASLPEAMKDQKRLITMGWDTLWCYLMLFMFIIAYPESMKDILVISSFGLILPWLIFAVIRYCPVNGWYKAAIIFAIVGVWTMAGSSFGWVQVMNKQSAVLIVSAIIAVLLAVVGLVSSRSK